MLAACAGRPWRTRSTCSTPARGCRRSITGPGFVPGDVRATPARRRRGQMTRASRRRSSCPPRRRPGAGRGGRGSRRGSRAGRSSLRAGPSRAPRGWVVEDLELRGARRGARRAGRARSQQEPRATARRAVAHRRRRRAFARPRADRAGDGRQRPLAATVAALRAAARAPGSPWSRPPAAAPCRGTRGGRDAVTAAQRREVGLGWPIRDVTSRISLRSSPARMLARSAATFSATMIARRSPIRPSTRAARSVPRRRARRTRTLPRLRVGGRAGAAARRSCARPRALGHAQARRRGARVLLGLLGGRADDARREHAQSAARAAPADGRSGGQMQPAAASRRKCLTIRSSSEWKRDHGDPPARREHVERVVEARRASAPSSSLTAMRSAWKTRGPGGPGRTARASGCAARIVSTSSPVR